jgi:hypothetical protein
MRKVVQNGAAGMVLPAKFPGEIESAKPRANHVKTRLVSEGA